MQCGDYSPRRKSHPSRSLLVDRNISTSSEASREKKPNRQTHHSDSQFLQNDPLKHRRVSSLSETPPLSLCTVQGRKRNERVCFRHTTLAMIIHNSDNSFNKKQKNQIAFQISLGHFLSSCFCAHVGVFDSFLLSLYV